MSHWKVGNAQLGRAGGKLRTGPGKFQRKTKPDELFKGVSLSAPPRNFRSAFKIVIIMTVVIIMTTIIITNDRQKTHSHPEGRAAPKRCPREEAALPTAGWGTWAEQQRVKRAQLRFLAREGEIQANPPRPELVYLVSQTSSFLFGLFCDFFFLIHIEYC